MAILVVSAEVVESKRSRRGVDIRNGIFDAFVGYNGKNGSEDISSERSPISRVAPITIVDAKVCGRPVAVSGFSPTSMTFAPLDRASSSNDWQRQMSSCRNPNSAVTASVNSSSRPRYFVILIWCECFRHQKTPCATRKRAGPSKPGRGCAAKRRIMFLS